MIPCWNESTQKRPIFQEVVYNIENLIAPLADYFDITVDSHS